MHKVLNIHNGGMVQASTPLIVDNGSQVYALLWNKNERTLLSSHEFTQNELTMSTSREDPIQL
ncbi:hypothetical protein U9M48_033681 [Paspalum notatum var. saurae]|uniref:Uncharacterized protein n=1 Tax=Paspalum notatum var. saurae TaxID=547442 RepID=A0AAQ3U7W3_PASNO